MFSSNPRTKYRTESFSKNRVSKTATSKKQRSFRDVSSLKQLEKVAQSSYIGLPIQQSPVSPSCLTSAIITICVGPEQRLFAAHEDVLAHSSFLHAACQAQAFVDAAAKRIDLPNEEPEVFSCVLEYLYKGDYSPKLQYDKRGEKWYLQEAEETALRDGLSPPVKRSGDTTMFINRLGLSVLKDTVVYCAAHKYGLANLKRLSLRKQGLQSGVQCSTILSSARYAYANTPDNDAKLRAHYLALIIRSRQIFKRSGTMQAEMEMGGRLFFDLFVAMVNHTDDLTGSKLPN